MRKGFPIVKYKKQKKCKKVYTLARKLYSARDCGAVAIAWVFGIRCFEKYFYTCTVYSSSYAA
jgi:hypothetical protein